MDKRRSEVVEHVDAGRISELFKYIERKHGPLMMDDPLMENKNIRNAVYSLMRKGVLSPVNNLQTGHDLKSKYLDNYIDKLIKEKRDPYDAMVMIEEKKKEIGWKEETVGYEVPGFIYHCRMERRRVREENRKTEIEINRYYGNNIGRMLNLMFNRETLPELNETYRKNVGDVVRQLKLVVTKKAEEDKFYIGRPAEGEKGLKEAVEKEVEERIGKAVTLLRILKDSPNISDPQLDWLTALVMTSDYRLRAEIVPRSRVEPVLQRAEDFEKDLMRRYGMKRPNRLGDYTFDELGVSMSNSTEIRKELDERRGIQ